SYDKMCIHLNLMIFTKIIRGFISAARLSTRAAQGIGAGLLTARLGIKAMELCRPLPWIEDDKPRLGDFRRQLIGQVKETLQKGKTPSEK
ncbi:DUF697 domain-containing protein, partial [Escherichia coli]|nr:DUF697 domain-containing protein [Escherichia coli]